MDKKKNTRSSAATLERARETEAACRRATTSIEHDTKIGTIRQSVHIADFLSVGAAHAVPLRDLVALTSQPERVIRRQIERERRAGIPILADCKNGYFLPDGEGEKARCVQSMRGRAKEILKTAAAIEKGENYKE